MKALMNQITEQARELEALLDSVMYEVNWAELSEYEVPSDTRSKEEIATEQAREEVFTSHKND